MSGVMGNARTVWLGTIWFLALGLGVTAAAKGVKTPLEVTYYYLPG